MINQINQGLMMFDCCPACGSKKITLKEHGTGYNAPEYISSSLGKVGQKPQYNATLTVEQTAACSKCNAEFSVRAPYHGAEPYKPILKTENEMTEAEYRERYPIGTALWSMTPSFYKGYTHWTPRPHSIETHGDEYGFGFGILPIERGNRWERIGKSYFTTREECLQDWGDRPRVTLDKRDVTEQESPDPVKYGEHTVWRGNGVSTLFITIGLDRERFDLGKLTWHTDKEMKRMTGNGEYLSLNEIRDQIHEWIRKEENIGAEVRMIVEVLEESPTSGIIHQVGNHDGSTWHKQGTTMGYA